MLGATKVESRNTGRHYFAKKSKKKQNAVLSFLKHLHPNSKIESRTHDNIDKMANFKLRLKLEAHQKTRDKFVHPVGFPELGKKITLLFFKNIVCFQIRHVWIQIHQISQSQIWWENRESKLILMQLKTKMREKKVLLTNNHASSLFNETHSLRH